MAYLTVAGAQAEDPVDGDAAQQQQRQQGQAQSQGEGGRQEKKKRKPSRRLSLTKAPWNRRRPAVSEPGSSVVGDGDDEDGDGDASAQQQDALSPTLTSTSFSHPHSHSHSHSTPQNPTLARTSFNFPFPSHLKTAFDRAYVLKLVNPGIISQGMTVPRCGETSKTRQGRHEERDLTRGVGVDE